MPTFQTRGWVFTLNNYTPEDESQIQNYPASYLIYGHEVGESGTPHLQGYLHTTNMVSLAHLKKKCSAKAHFEPQRGSVEENIAYCSKENNNVFIKGRPPSQGQRTDIEKAVKQIVNGEITVDQIVLQNPMLYQQCGRTLSRAEDLVRRKLFRTEMTQGIWFHGPTGVGKSHRVFEGYHPDTHYLWKYDGGWQDGYVGQETVIINEFRGQIPLCELLQLVDKWPYDLRRRNREPMPFTSKKVLLTCSLLPEEVYTNLGNDRIDQLYRRFEIVHIEHRE